MRYPPCLRHSSETAERFNSPQHFGLCWSTKTSTSNAGPISSMSDCSGAGGSTRAFGRRTVAGKTLMPTAVVSDRSLPALAIRRSASHSARTMLARLGAGRRQASEEDDKDESRRPDRFNFDRRSSRDRSVQSSGSEIIKASRRDDRMRSAFVHSGSTAWLLASTTGRSTSDRIWNCAARQLDCRISPNFCCRVLRGNTRPSVGKSAWQLPQVAADLRPRLGLAEASYLATFVPG